MIPTQRGGIFDRFAKKTAVATGRPMTFGIQLASEGREGLRQGGSDTGTPSLGFETFAKKE